MRNVILLFCVLLTAFPIFTQEKSVAEELWMGACAETASFGLSNFAYGAGINLAYGNRFSIGFKTAYFYDTVKYIANLELGFLFRFNFFDNLSGPFIQFTGGPVIFLPANSNFTLPANWGTVSAGISAGWRFLLGNIFFLEPFIRGGYPFIFGAGLSGGVHF